MQLFYIQNRKNCLSKKILYQYFAVFLPCLPQLLFWKYFIYHYITLKSKENINHLWLFKLGERNNRHSVYQFLKFMLGCRFSFKAYANIREKATKCSLKTTEVLLNTDGHVLTFSLIFIKVAPNCFNSHTNSWCPDFFKKNCLMSDLKSPLFDIVSFLPDNLSGLKKDNIHPCKAPRKRNTL